MDGVGLALAPFRLPNRAEASSTRLVVAGSETLPFRTSVCTRADLAVCPCADLSVDLLAGEESTAGGAVLLKYVGLVAM